MNNEIKLGKQLRKAAWACIYADLQRHCIPRTISRRKNTLIYRGSSIGLAQIECDWIIKSPEEIHVYFWSGDGLGGGGCRPHVYTNCLYDYLGPVIERRRACIDVAKNPNGPKSKAEFAYGFEVGVKDVYENEPDGLAFIDLMREHLDFEGTAYQGLDWGEEAVGWAVKDVRHHSNGTYENRVKWAMDAHPMNNRGYQDE